MSTPVLDHEQHVYTLEGKPLVSVSKVIATLIKSGLKDVDPETLKRAATRGSLVEQYATELMRTGFVTVATDHDGVMERMEIFERWWLNAQPELIDAQRVVWSEIDGTAGTIDWLMNVRGKRYLVDCKCTSQPSPTWELQLGGYLSMLEEAVDGIAILHIKPGYAEGYIWREYDQDRAVARWRRAVDWYWTLQYLKAEAAESSVVSDNGEANARN